MVPAKAALVAAMLLLAAPAAALTIRGDHDWVSSPACPERWMSTAFDDSSWRPVAFPWLLLWPSPWEPDAEARPFWDPSGAGTACTRRVFDLPHLPSGPAVARIYVDDDYEFWLNDTLVGESKDDGAERPGESYEVGHLLRPGRNVIGLKIIDTAYEKGAYFSLAIAGLPEQPPSAAARRRALEPWLQFAAIAGALLAFALLVLLLLRRLQPLVAGLPAWLVGPLTLALAISCQWVLLTREMYTAWPEQPAAEWSWPALALAAALFLVLFALREADSATDDGGPIRGERLWLVAILALAAFLRIWRIDSVPVGFYQDEATNGLDALHLTELEEISLWSDSVGGRPTLFLYLLGVCLKLFGTSYLSLKILPIAVSLASVAAVYAVARAGLGPRAALWAAFFLAVSRWHIHYARMAWEVNCVPLFSAAGFALLLHGLGRERGGERSLVAGAAVIALGLYTYAAYRAVPVAALLFLLLTLFSAERRLLRRRWRALLRAGAAATVVALPLAGFAFVHPERYWERYNDVSLTYYMSYYGTPLPWLHQIGKGLLSLNHLGDELIRHNLPKAPHLDAVTGVFFLLGLASAARPHQRLALRLLWCWLLVFLALASLTRDAPHATRYLGLVAPAVLFAGFGAARLLARLRRALRFAPLTWPPAAALAGGTAALNAYQYFAVEAHHPSADFEMNLTARVVCERLRQHRGVKVYWTSDVAYWAGGPCYFLTGGRAKTHELKPEELAAGNLGDKIDGPTIFFVGPEHVDRVRGRVQRDNDDLPILGLPGYPEIQRDRRGRLMFYVWDRTGSRAPGSGLRVPGSRSSRGPRWAKESARNLVAPRPRAMFRPITRRRT